MVARANLVVFEELVPGKVGLLLVIVLYQVVKEFEFLLLVVPYLLLPVALEVYQVYLICPTLYRREL